MDGRKTIIPLAPPIDDSSSKRPFEWKSYWLSPKPKALRRHRENENYDDVTSEYYDASRSRQQQQRPRRASFDQTSNDGSSNNNNNVRLNIKRGGQRYFKRNSHEGALLYPTSKSSINDSEEGGTMSFIATSRSVDDTIDETTEQLGGMGDIERGRYHHHRTSSSSSSSQPLLTAFLLQLTSLLPEYCEHLSDTSNTLHSIGSASKAVDVLERGAKTLSATFCSVDATSSTSAPNSPSHVLVDDSAASPNNNNKHHQSPKSDSDAASNSPSSDSNYWLSPLSPRGGNGRIISLSPTKKKKMKQKIITTKQQQQRQMRQQKLAESEWERFVAPFVNLFGAECFYAKMDHVLDPKRCNSTEEDLMSSSEQQEEQHTYKMGKDSSSFVKFTSPSSQKNETQGSSNEIQGNVDAPIDPPVSPVDANKRGSRRLILLYKQIRDELIIVGKLVWVWVQHT